MSSTCKKSHDVFRAVVLEDQKKSKKRKRKDENKSAEVDISFQANGSANNDKASRQERFKGHRAGHDAFMTAFCFASFIAQKYSARPTELNAISCWKEVVADVKNRVCLSGKDFPLIIQKSAFSKCSKSHIDKYNKLVSDQPAQ